MGAPTKHHFQSAVLKMVILINDLFLLIKDIIEGGVRRNKRRLAGCWLWVGTSHKRQQTHTGSYVPSIINSHNTSTYTRDGSLPLFAQEMSVRHSVTNMPGHFPRKILGTLPRQGHSGTLYPHHPFIVVNACRVPLQKLSSLGDDIYWVEVLTKAASDTEKSPLVLITDPQHQAYIFSLWLQVLFTPNLPCFFPLHMYTYTWYMLAGVLNYVLLLDLGPSSQNPQFPRKFMELSDQCRQYDTKFTAVGYRNNEVNGGGELS